MTWIAPLLGSLLLGLADDPRPMWVFVGTYTTADSKGIYRLDFDPQSGTLTGPTLAAESENPSFLAVHPSRRFLYAVNEVDQVGGKPGGGVTAFALDPKSGSLARLNAQSTVGDGPCHLAVDRTGRMLIAANYGGGSVVAFPIAEDGRVAKASTFIQHEGSSVNKARQAGPHAHAVVVDAANRFAVAADLGLDKLFVYKLDPARAILVANDPPFAQVAPGVGPRHFAFHPNGKHAYAINEMACTVTAFDYDPSKATLAEVQTISTRAPGSRPGNSTAEILVHPSGKFVYGSNRGDDSLAIYAVEPASGTLNLVGHQSTGGKTPRNFGIDPTGHFLIAAHQDSSSLVVFRIDVQTGLLKQVGEPVTIPAPVCVKFVPIGG
jgi:6-phosphogluconolactonase